MKLEAGFQPSGQGVRERRSRERGQADTPLSSRALVREAGTRPGAGLSREEHLPDRASCGDRETESLLPREMRFPPPLSQPQRQSEERSGGKGLIRSARVPAPRGGRPACGKPSQERVSRKGRSRPRAQQP